MSESIFEVVERGCGWELLDNGKRILWFPEREKALDIASVMADARSAFHGVPASVHAPNEDGEMELVASFKG